MKRERLQAMLRQLHDELEQAEGVDSETLVQLRTQTENMQSMLETRDDSAAGDIQSEASGLKDLLLRFEAEHPELAAAVGKVADALAAMGI